VIFYTTECFTCHVELLTHATWVNLENTVLNEISQTKRQICMIPLKQEVPRVEREHRLPRTGGVGGRK
jgi:hypothetical protein